MDSQINEGLKTIWATKNTLNTFHYTGCWIGISIMAYNKPYNKGEYNPQYKLKNRFFL